jgi:hypothetical protein
VTNLTVPVARAIFRMETGYEKKCKTIAGRYRF